MLLNLLKLLPTNIRNIKYYSDLITVFQSLLYNDVKGKISEIENRDDPLAISVDVLPSMFYEYGFDLTQGSEFTNSELYLRRQYQTLFKKIPIKGTWRSYQYIFYVYGLTGTVYPLIQNINLYLDPWYSWIYVPESIASNKQLDTGDTLDNGWFLDAGAIFTGVTRHFLLSYEPNFVEDTTQYMSTETCRALYNDVVQNKRRIEMPHFEFKVSINANIDYSVRTEQIQKFDLSNEYGYKKSIYISSDLTQVDQIQFGSGQYSVIDNTITGVQQLVNQYSYSAFTEIGKTATGLTCNSVIYDNTKWDDFREIALLDSLGNCIFYAEMPWVRFFTNSLSSVYLTISII